MRSNLAGYYQSLTILGGLAKHVLCAETLLLMSRNLERLWMFLIIIKIKDYEDY